MVSEQKRKQCLFALLRRPPAAQFEILIMLVEGHLSESGGRARLCSVGGCRVISCDGRFQPTVPSRVELCIQPRVDSLDHSDIDRIRLEKESPGNRTDHSDQKEGCVNN